MSEQIGLWQVTYAPGQWVVLGGPTSPAILRPEPSRTSAVIKEFWEIVVQADSLDSLVGQLAQHNVEQMPDFAAFFWHDGAMRSLVRGAPRVVDLDSGETLAAGEGVRTWTESGLGEVRRVRVVLEPGVDPESEPRLPLVVGAVTAAVVDLDAEATVTSPQQRRFELDQPKPQDQPEGDLLFPPTEAFTPAFAPQQSPGDQPPPQGFPPQGFEPLQPFTDGPPPLGSGRGDEEQWVPAGDPGHGERIGGGEKTGEMVLAVVCPHGHPNAPEAQRCRRCGGPLQGQPRMVPRPAMALLRPSTGAPVEVDRSVLIGRSPQANRVARDQLPRLLTVPSPSQDISRAHLQVSPEGWELAAIDLHSTNGTLLIRPGHPEPERMPPGEPLPVYPGCVLDLGDGVTILVDHPA